MANNKPTQQAILSTDVEEKAPDTSVEETAKKTSGSKKTQSNSSISKSRRRTSLDEFAIVNELRPEYKAGFAAWLREHGGNFHFDDEWNELYKQYTNRQL